MTPKLLMQKLYEGIRSVIPELPHWDELSDEMRLQIMKDVLEAFDQAKLPK
jgi:hypothetical protein